MVGAARYAAGMEHTPPPLLQKALLCQRWRCLPSQIAEEDYQEIMSMTSALNVYDAFCAWKNRTPGKEAEFAKNNPSAWRIVKDLLKEVTDGKQG